MDKAKDLPQNGASLENILQHLNLDEQMESADIGEKFCFLITKALWKKDYRDLNIYKTPNISIISSNWQEYSEEDSPYGELQRIHDPKMAITGDNYNVFLTEIANGVSKLRVFSEYIVFRHSIGVPFQTITMFRNLRHLSYHQMLVTNEHMELIAKHCLKVRKLELFECSDSESYSLIPAFNLDIGTLAKMSQLREFVLQSTTNTPLPQMPSNVLYEMLKKLQLKSLVFKNIQIIETATVDVGKIPNGDRLEILNLGNISLDSWTGLKKHLKYFCFLSELTLNFMDSNTLFNSLDIEILAVHCRKLQRLSLGSCELSVKEFDLINTLRHLELLSCEGFTAANLQQVLAKLHLLSLSLIDTGVLGSITDCCVSSSLESIKVDSINCSAISEAFQKSQNCMLKLHTINWLNGDITGTWILDKCPNLRRLHIPNPNAIGHNILKMGSLQELSLSSCKGFDWSFFLRLIEEMTLKLLKLHTDETFENAQELPQKSCRMKTSLETIIIPYHIYAIAQEFWMDLLNKNGDLKMIFYGDHEDLLETQLLLNLLKFPHVQNNLKIIRVCGFSTSISDLQNNFENTLRQLNAKTNHYKSKNATFTIEL